MKTYIIETIHEVYLYDYTNGEGEFIHCYTMKSEQNADTFIEAIKKHYEKELFLSFNKINMDSLDGVGYYSNLVDVENSEATDSEVNEWKERKVNLYSNNQTINASVKKEIEIHTRFK